MLHLLKNNYNNFHEEYLGPEIITAHGIKNSLECNLGYLSRLFNKYKQEGLIYRKKMKIENKKQKQFVYYLSDEGLKLAKKIENSYNKKIKKI